MKKDHLIIDGKMYVTTRRAAEIAGYSADYVGQLCRAGKIERRMINRVWYVEKDSILRHSEEAFKANHTSFKTDDFKLVTPLLLTSPRGQVSTLLPSVTERYVMQNHRSVLKTLRTAVVLTFVIVSILFGTISLAVSSHSYFVNNHSVSLVADAGSAWDTFVNKFVLPIKCVVTNSCSTSTDDLPIPGTSPAGLVVIPSENNSSANIKLANTITNSFSDPVSVQQNGNGNSGIIKPEFRTVKGHDYLYVLVPVKTASSASVVSSDMATSTASNY